MKRIMLIILAMIFLAHSVYSQDTLVVTSVKRAEIREVKTDTVTEKKDTLVRKASYNAAPAKQVDLNAVQTFETPLGSETVVLGLGLGTDHGGYGVNILAYPQKNFGLFAGVGYNLVGVGFNAGAKIRFVPKDPELFLSPHFLIMGGYHTTVKVTNARELNKTFYGVTLGFGIDLKYSTVSRDYMSFSLLVPLRNNEPQDYIDYLTVNYGAVFERKLLPVGFSISYRIVLN